MPGEGVDLIRESVRLVMQELIKVDATERIGADRYERTDIGSPTATGLAQVGGYSGRRYRAADP